MEQELFLSKINALSSKTKYLKTYPVNKINLLKGIGRITGETDQQHIDFLNLTNGLSILDYCFWGIKNPRLYPTNIYDEMQFLWGKYYQTALVFWCIAGDEQGGYFGYIPYKNGNGDHFIAYFNENIPDELIIISSSFEKFLANFLALISCELEKDNNILSVDHTQLFDFSIYKDEELENYLKQNDRLIDLIKLHKK